MKNVHLPRFLLLMACVVAPWGAGAAGAATERAVEALIERARPLAAPADLTPLIERMGEARYVLLGEASHGTAEFYTWRDQMSRRLIAEKGFRFIAVEGDWEACYRLNRYVKHLPGAGKSARAILTSFDRWPQWMWANEEVETLIEWLRVFNEDREPAARVGFYGIDLYGTEDSMQRVLTYLGARDAEAARQAESAFACLAAFSESYGHYAWAARDGAADCAPGIDAVIEHLRANAGKYREENAKAFFDAKINAVAVRNAEKHYRTRGDGADSWNHRVDHFLEVVERVAAYKGDMARGIVWAHNTHIGDARATAMHERGSTNIGQLLRERHGDEAVFAAGFSTHRGQVLAGRAWAAPRERMTVPPARAGSLEDLLHQAARAMGSEQFFILLDRNEAGGPLQQRWGHRAMGVVYQPENEHGNYVPTVLPRRYDALIHLEETGPLRPIHP